MRSAKSSSSATASVARPARSSSRPASHPSHGSESTGISGRGAPESEPANITKRLQASSELSTYGHPSEKTTRIARSGRSGSARKMAWSHHGSFDGSSTRSTSRRRSRESAMPITMATARVNAAPLANKSGSGTATWRRKDGTSSGARDAARSAVIARKRPAPATSAAPGNPWSLIGGGAEGTPVPGLFAMASPDSNPVCCLFIGAPRPAARPPGGDNVTDVPRIAGVLSPVVTPFGADLAPDPERFVHQCRWLLSQNVGLAIFGTNSEANSLSVDEKVELLDRLAGAGFDVFAGSETFLLQNMRYGGAGCISATANVHPEPIARLYDTWRAEGADAQQARLDVIRGVFQRFPMIPALKAAIAHHGRDAGWATVRPPLVALTPAQSSALIAELDAQRFTMPGLAGR